MNRPSAHASLLDELLVPAIALAILVGATVWLTGQLAALLTHGAWPAVGADDLGGIVARLVQSPGDPASAWPAPVREELPGPVLFYAVLVGVGAAPVAIWVWWTERRRARREVRPDAARWATRRDLRPLRVRRPEPGRLTLGRDGGALLAAEPRQSVLVFGPTQTGKTTALAIPAILEWPGPVVCTSVKTDLLRDTIDARRRVGDVLVYDPTGQTGYLPSGWTPLSACITWQGAQRTAAWLVDAARSRNAGIENSEFWFAAAGKLLAPVLLAAGIESGDMGDVMRWVDVQDMDDVRRILHRAGERAAFTVVEGIEAWEPRTRSSIYTTAQTVLAAYQDPAVLGSTLSADISPDRLLGELPTTLYLCAPAHEQRRLQPLFATLVNQLLHAAYERAARSRLDPPLLVVLDECANIAPIRELGNLAATAASHGIQLVTVFQDMSQIDAVYGRDRTPTIVNNHRARLALTGIADERTLSYLERLVGETSATQTSTTRVPGSSDSETTQTAYRALAPAALLRSIPPGEAVLLYGHLHPARIRLRPWYRESSLRRLVHDPAAASSSDP